MKFIFPGNGGFFILILSLLLVSCKSQQQVQHKEKNKHVTESGILEKYAILLNVEKDKLQNNTLYAFIDSWYGIPYRYGGKSKEGVDCSNFTAILYHDVFNETLLGNSEGLFLNCETLSRDQLAEGDLVFFKIEKEKISHVGVYLHNNKFVHATTQKGVMIDDLNSTYYDRYFYKGGRPRIKPAGK